MAFKYTPAAKEDTYRLIAKAQSGDRAAREQVVAQNIGLVKNLALKYTSAYYETEDLIQVGFVGLVKAIDRFDPEFGVMFSTYAVPIATKRRNQKVKKSDSPSQMHFFRTLRAILFCSSISRSSRLRTRCAISFCFAASSAAALSAASAFA